MLVRNNCIGFLLICLASASTLTKPPQSALIIGFEKSYEQSLLAHSLSDQGIDSTLIVLSDSREKIYENLRGIEIIKLNISIDHSADKDALRACEALISDRKILQRVRQIQPTFVLFPALRHDACLLPWTKFISSIPVIVSYGPDEDHYTVQRTRVALPIHTGSLWSGFWSIAGSRSVISDTDNNYVPSALKLARLHLPELEIDLDELYSKAELIMSAGDPILRTDFALLGHQFVDIGCHHCRGAHPLPTELQKELVEFRLGTVAVTLDESFSSLVEEIARRLPQGRQGQAIAWKNYNVHLDSETKPDNLFVHGEVDRQDLVGYARARVLLSHCADTEFLETAFHGTPVICFPRDSQELMNSKRAIDFGFSVSIGGATTAEAIAAAVEHIHKTASYREIAREVSVLIRDRPLPASDRLHFWLGYLARSADRTIKLRGLKANEVRTFTGDSLLLSGFFLGTILSSVLILAALFAWNWTKNGQKQFRKDKKFIR